MDRLVKPEAKEVELFFQKGQKCTTTFKLTNLMHTMTVAVSLTTTNPSIFSINKPLSVIPPLSSASYTLHLSPPGQPPLSDPPDVITVRTSMLPTGKSPTDHLRRLFSRPGPHVFRDAVISVSLVGPYVAEFLISQPLQSRSLFTKAISACSKPHLTKLLKPAVESGETETVTALIAAGGDPKGVSLIPVAIRAGKLEFVKLLVASGCRINDSVEANMVLLEAAAVDRIDVLEFLFENFRDELDVKSANSKGVTAVHVAAMEGHVRVIELLISKGGDPEAVDSEGWTPLHFAAWRGHPKAVECLLERADVKRVRDRTGRTPFSVAEECGHAHLLGLLRWGDAVFRAARADDVHGLKRCLGEGAAVGGRDQNGWTPLHWAAFKGRIKSVKVLLEHGAVVDAVDDAGYTPLHCAAEAGHLQVALLLIAHGGSQASLKSFQHVAPLNLDSFQKYVSFDYECKSIA